MAGEIVVRRATRGDAAALAALSLESSADYARIAPELFANGESEGFSDWIAAEWDDGPGTLALVAEIDGAVAGYLEAIVQSPSPGDGSSGAATTACGGCSSAPC